MDEHPLIQLARTMCRLVWIAAFVAALLHGTGSAATALTLLLPSLLLLSWISHRKEYLQKEWMQMLENLWAFICLCGTASIGFHVIQESIMLKSFSAVDSKWFVMILVLWLLTLGGVVGVDKMDDVIIKRSALRASRQQQEDVVGQLAIAQEGQKGDLSLAHIPGELEKC